MSVEDIEEDGALVHVLDVLDLLGDVLRGRSDTSDGQENVVLQEVAGEHLNVAWEGGTEHKGLSVLDVWHILTLDNAANLWLETHVQHAISLIEDKVLDIAKGDAATLDQINETTWSGDKEIASALHLAELGTDIGSSVDDTWLDPGSVGKLAGLLVNLGDQLTGWSQDEGGWVSLALATEVLSGTGWNSGWAVDESLGQDWEEETSSLSRTSLGTSHKITSTHDNWDGVLLDWSWDFVVSKLDVADQVVIQRWVGEGENWLWNVGSGSLDWDIVVLLEVDTSLLLGWVVLDAEKLTLETLIGWAGSVLALLPGAITASAGDTAAATLVSRVAAALKVRWTSTVVPSATTAWWWSSAWSEGWSSSPIAAWSWSISSEAIGSRVVSQLGSTVMIVLSWRHVRSWGSPRAVVHAAVHLAIHWWWSAWSWSAHFATHVWWDVGAEWLLATLLAVVDVEAVHVKLVSHVG